MLDAIRHLITDNLPGTPGAHSRTHPHDVRVAACALLLELAHADGEFSDVERTRIEAILQRHFGVDADGARALMAEADSAHRDAVDHFTFTRQLVREYDTAQRVLLAEVMWSVTLADGTLDDHEGYLMRKLSSLLELEPAFLSEARRRSGAAG
jgi:uncharacterized tellurite resistance protein B-like protein